MLALSSAAAGTFAEELGWRMGYELDKLYLEICSYAENSYSNILVIGKTSIPRKIVEHLKDSECLGIRRILLLKIVGVLCTDLVTAKLIAVDYGMLLMCLLGLQDITTDPMSLEISLHYCNLLAFFCSDDTVIRGFSETVLNKHKEFSPDDSLMTGRQSEGAASSVHLSLPGSLIDSGRDSGSSGAKKNTMNLFYGLLKFCCLMSPSTSNLTIEGIRALLESTYRLTLRSPKISHNFGIFEENMNLLRYLLVTEHCQIHLSWQRALFGISRNVEKQTQIPEILVNSLYGILYRAARGERKWQVRTNNQNDINTDPDDHLKLPKLQKKAANILTSMAAKNAIKVGLSETDASVAAALASLELSRSAAANLHSPVASKNLEISTQAALTMPPLFAEALVDLGELFVSLSEKKPLSLVRLVDASDISLPLLLRCWLEIGGYNLSITCIRMCASFITLGLNDYTRIRGGPIVYKAASEYFAHSPEIRKQLCDILQAVEPPEKIGQVAHLVLEVSRLIASQKIPDEYGNMYLNIITRLTIDDTPKMKFVQSTLISILTSNSANKFVVNLTAEPNDTSVEQEAIAFAYLVHAVVDLMEKAMSKASGTSLSRPSSSASGRNPFNKLPALKESQAGWAQSAKAAWKAGLGDKSAVPYSAAALANMASLTGRFVDVALTLPQPGKMKALIIDPKILSLVPSYSVSGDLLVSFWEALNQVIFSGTVSEAEAVSQSSMGALKSVSVSISAILKFLGFDQGGDLLDFQENQNALKRDSLVKPSQMKILNRNIGFLIETPETIWDRQVQEKLFAEIIEKSNSRSAKFSLITLPLSIAYLGMDTKTGLSVGTARRTSITMSKQQTEFPTHFNSKDDAPKIADKVNNRTAENSKHVMVGQSVIEVWENLLGDQSLFTESDGSCNALSLMSIATVLSNPQNFFDHEVATRVLQVNSEILGAYASQFGTNQFDNYDKLYSSASQMNFEASELPRIWIAVHSSRLVLSLTSINDRFSGLSSQQRETLFKGCLGLLLPLTIFCSKYCGTSDGIVSREARKSAAIALRATDETIDWGLFAGDVVFQILALIEAVTVNGVSHTATHTLGSMRLGDYLRPILELAGASFATPTRSSNQSNVRMALFEISVPHWLSVALFDSCLVVISHSVEAAWFGESMYSALESILYENRLLNLSEKGAHYLRKIVSNKSTRQWLLNPPARAINGVIALLNAPDKKFRLFSEVAARFRNHNVKYREIKEKILQDEEEMRLDQVTLPSQSSVMSLENSRMKKVFELLEKEVDRVDRFLKLEICTLNHSLSMWEIDNRRLDCLGLKESRESIEIQFKTFIKQILELECFARLNIIAFKKLSKNLDKQVLKESNSLANPLHRRPHPSAIFLSRVNQAELAKIDWNQMIKRVVEICGDGESRGIFLISDTEMDLGEAEDKRRIMFEMDSADLVKLKCQLLIDGFKISKFSDTEERFFFGSDVQGIIGKNSACFQQGEKRVYVSDARIREAAIEGVFDECEFRASFKSEISTFWKDNIYMHIFENIEKKSTCFIEASGSACEKYLTRFKFIKRSIHPSLLDSLTQEPKDEVQEQPRVAPILPRLPPRAAPLRAETLPVRDTLIKVEPKSFFANERSLIDWTHISVLFMTVGISSEVRLVRKVASFIAMIIVSWAIVKFIVRRRAMLLNDGDAYDVWFGPVVVVALISSFALLRIFNFTLNA